MSSFLTYLTLFFVGLGLAAARSHVISFNVDPNIGFYEGYFDERTREVEMKTPIHARMSTSGVSASGRICGFHLWNRAKDGTLPFIIVRKDDGKAILKAKTGAGITYAKQHLYNFFVQAFDCDPIRHVSVKVAVRIYVIPNELPKWTAKAYSFSVLEREPAGTKVGKVRAWEHGDRMNKRMCAYSIVRPQDAPFDVDGNGVLWTRRTLYYSEVVNYILRVKAEDCWVPKSRSSLVSVNIRVLPVCRPGWQGLFAQINYRAGSGSRTLFGDEGLSLVPSCDPAVPSVREVSLQLILEPGERSACPQRKGCPLTSGERIGESGHKQSLTYTGPSVAAAAAWLRANFVFENSDLEPTPSKRLVRLKTSIQFNAKSSAGKASRQQLPDQTVTVVILPRLVSLLQPRLSGGDDPQVVSDAVLSGPGFPVLQSLELVREGAQAGQEPSVEFCVLRVHPKLTPVAYLSWPKEAVRSAGLKALNTSEQLNLKGVASAGLYRDILRGVRYHHGYPFALNSSSFVLVCLEHNAPAADAGSSAMLLLRLRIHHEVTAAPEKVTAVLREPPAVVLHEERIPSFEDKAPNRAASNLRSHAQPAIADYSGTSPAGTWSAGAIVGFALGLFFLALATYLAVLRWRRYRHTMAAAGASFEARAKSGGLVRAESQERQGGSGLEMEWDNSELNITVNPMQETFTKYCQVVHYREFSSDDEAEDDEEDLSSLLSGIPEEGEEEAGRSSGGSVGGTSGGVSSGNGGGGGEDQDWQWEDDMLPAYTHRPAANARL